ncbi:hypothetical protein JIR001_17430 [Polycladomyces abyssicola]|uniref:Uncharacterized protein n=1 Tax=Polycladomyces abyssicola TaxID=1125966 RepID=A0A8D5ZMR7_9BACL|nr:hypothetical protein JIR001_17430 [Polycladomyces abyssicola]
MEASRRRTTVVIRELVKNLEAQYVKGLKEWEKVINETHQCVVRFIQTVVRTGYVVTPCGLSRRVTVSEILSRSK